MLRERLIQPLGGDTPELLDCLIEDAQPQGIAAQ